MLEEWKTQKMKNREMERTGIIFVILRELIVFGVPHSNVNDLNWNHS